MSTEPWIDPDDITPSRISLTQGVSDPVKEEKVQQGRYWLQPDEIELKLGDKPGFEFVVLHTIKDRALWAGEGTIADRNLLACLGQMDQSIGQWVGQLLIDPDASTEHANLVSELQTHHAGGQCRRCEYAGDIRQAPRGVIEWRNACKFRWRYAIRILSGLPKDYEHPPFVIMELKPMPGRDGAGEMSNKLGRIVTKGLYTRTFRANKPAMDKKKQYFKWAFADVGPTDPDVIEEIKGMLTEHRAILSQEPMQIEGPKTSDAAPSGGDDLPF